MKSSGSRSKTTAPSGNPEFILHLEGQPQHLDEHGIIVPPEKKIVPPEENIDPDGLCREKDYKSLRKLLRKCEILHMDGERTFWPDKILRKIMTRERVIEELQKMQNSEKYEHLFEEHNVEWYADHIVPIEDLAIDFANGVENGIEASPGAISNGKDEPKRYLKIFALLLLCQEKASVKGFIDAGVCDSDLPLMPCEGANKNEKCGFATWKQPKEKLSCFKGWKASIREQFSHYQYQLQIPYFGPPLDEKQTIRHAKFRKRTILPWIDKKDVVEGGYGVVSCIRIHSASHGFHDYTQVRKSRYNHSLNVGNPHWYRPIGYDLP
jgi:hypothetical protein